MIAEGRLTDPLPSVRDWSARLGVSSDTLQAALKMLKQEGVLFSRPRKGLFLTDHPPRTRRHAPLVRWLWHDPRNRSVPPAPDLLIECSQRLATYDIHFRFERCDERRLRTIHATSNPADEILIFSNIGVTFQRLFQKHCNALIVGDPMQGIDLPFITCDIFPVFRHAAYRLLRRGCRHIEFLNIIGRRHPRSFRILEEEFEKVRAEAPIPFIGGVTLLPTPQDEQCLAIRRLARRFVEKQGLILNAPLLPGMVAMVLMDSGFRIPDQVEILPVNATPGQMMIYPPTPCYPYPVEAMVKAICKTADHYFKTGEPITIRKSIPLSLRNP